MIGLLVASESAGERIWLVTKKLSNGNWRLSGDSGKQYRAWGKPPTSFYPATSDWRSVGLVVIRNDEVERMMAKAEERYVVAMMRAVPPHQTCAAILADVERIRRALEKQRAKLLEAAAVNERLLAGAPASSDE